MTIHRGEKLQIFFWGVVRTVLILGGEDSLYFCCGLRWRPYNLVLCGMHRRASHESTCNFLLLPWTLLLRNEFYFRPGQGNYLAYIEVLGWKSSFRVRRILCRWVRQWE